MCHSQVVEIVFFFFFSSRRRHTRWTGDWSSDVCSSDLIPIFECFVRDNLASTKKNNSLEVFAFKVPRHDPYTNKTFKDWNTLPLSKFLWRYRFMFSKIGRASCRERV